MKKELLEYIVRECIKEVLNTVMAPNNSNAFETAQQEYKKWEENFLRKSASHWEDILRRGQQEVVRQLVPSIEKLSFIRALGDQSKEAAEIFAGDTAMKMHQLFRDKKLKEASANPPNSTIGAPAPPAAGQGTADQPPIPDQSPAAMISSKKGIWYVDPKNPSKPIKATLTAPQDAAKLERELRTMAKSGGPALKIAANTLREVPKAAANPNASLYLYIGKQRPDDIELYLLPAKTYQQAKSLSIVPQIPSAEPPVSTPPTPTPTAPVAPTGGSVEAPNINESSKQLRNLISGMIKEALKSSK